MEIRLLQYFLMVAEEGNITRAAERLHMTQPSLSRQMRQLERELGTGLFLRERQGLVLTEDGFLLKERAREIVALAERTEADFQKEDRELSGVVSIGSGDLLNSRILFDMAADFQKKHRHVRFDVYSGHSSNIKERIENGLLHMGLLLEPVDVRDYDFLRMKEREEMMVWVSESSPLAKKACITPEDLAGESLILPGREKVQGELRNWLGPCGESLSVTAVGTLPYNSKMMVRAGMGVSFGVRMDCTFSGVKALPLAPALEMGALLAWKKDVALPSQAAAFIDHVRQSLAAEAGRSYAR